MSEKHQKIKAKVIFEIVGNPKEYIVEALEKYLKALKEDREMQLTDEYVAQPEEKDKLWSTFAEVDITFNNLEKLTWLCINFMPASVEILEPGSLTMSDKNISDWINDLVTKLHEVSIQTKALTSENDLLKLNINRLIRNSILVVLRRATGGKTTKEICAEIGVEDDEVLLPFFEAMQKEQKIKKVNGLYHLA